MNLPEAIHLLCRLIATPSRSRHEGATADILYAALEDAGTSPRRTGNNVYALSDGFDPSRPTLMLNSHHDTVAPASTYTRPPYEPTEEDGRIYGLGSNDAGASLVSLMSAFLALRQERLPFNLLLALTAEEEVGGEGGMRAFLPHIASEGIMPAWAVVGEPTGMRPAVAERGLVVLDAVTAGVAGHAARGEGINAIYRAMADIDALRQFSFPRTSDVLGPVGVNITQIEAGRVHNAIPDSCRWVVDVRTTDAFSNEDVVELLRGAVSGHTVLTPRSTRVRASVISAGHPLVAAFTIPGHTPFVSPTTSDMSLMYDIPSLKIGPGDSARSHSADEYVMRAEIEEAIGLYINSINRFSKTFS